MSTSSLPHRWCVGIDLHKDTLTACLYCPCCGEIRFQKLVCKCRKQIAEFFGSLPQPHVVAIEAVGFYRWLWELLEPLVDKLVLADATQARALAGRRMKTDREDAQNIAELLACGRLPLAYAPPFEVQVLRDCSRQRNALSRQHAHALHRAKSVMNANNRPGPARMDSAALIRYLKAFESKLPERHGRYLWQCVDQLVLIERQLSQLEIELERLLAQPAFAPLAAILNSFPGVGLVTCSTVLAEVGDFSRFKYRKSISRYAGFDPRTFDSAGKQRAGHISKRGPSNLRWVLGQAAWTAVRLDPHVKRIWLRISRKSGKKVAIVAIARRLLLWMWRAVCSGQPFRTPVAA
jgi:transposase